MRKPIEISVTGVENTISTQCNYVTTVLCDDGSIWQTNNRMGEKDAVGGWYLRTIGKYVD